MLAPPPNSACARHAVDLLAHLVEGGVTRWRSASVSSATICSMVMRGWWNTATPLASPFTSARPRICSGPVSAAGRPPASSIHQIGIGDQFGQHHGHRLQRLDLHLFIAARIDMLDAQAPTARSRRTIGTPAKEWNLSSPVSGR
jgi:hypothetical protein